MKVVGEASRTPGRPLPDLARLLLRRSAMVSLAVLLAAVVLGVLSVRHDVQHEVDAGALLAHALAQVAAAEGLSDAQLLQRMRQLQHKGPLRHLALRILDHRGQVLHQHQGVEDAAGAWPWPLSTWLGAATGASGDLAVARSGPVVAWPLQRPAGPPWRVELYSSRADELDEALGTLRDALALLLLCVGGVLFSTHWTVRHALRPLDRLVQALQRMGADSAAPLSALPPMPVRELDLIAATMRDLAGALSAAQAQRRVLSHKLLNLQESEAARLAQELHDELGQRVTAMRVRVAMMQRAGAPAGVLSDGLAQLGRDCADLQQDVRLLLAGLQPLGHPLLTQAGESVARLASVIQALVARWPDDGAGGALKLRLTLRSTDAEGADAPWPSGLAADELALPRTLVLVVYRITQESLTNIVRHAKAQQALVSLRLRRAPDGGVSALDWQVDDDGVGVSDLPAALNRGNGLAGIHQRLWSVGGQLTISAHQASRPRPGLRLFAHIAIDAVPADAPATSGNQRISLEHRPRG